MILLQASGVSRKFADITLYDDVTFSIKTHDRIALVGRNGTGKSTLIKQIMGQEPVNNGSFSQAKGLKIGYLEQHVAINSDKTIWEEMLAVFENSLALRKEAEKAADDVAHLANNGDYDSERYQAAIDKYDQIQMLLAEKNVYQIESDIRMVLHGLRFYEEDYNTPVQSLSGGQKTRLALAQILLRDYDLLILDEPTNHLDMETLAWLENHLSSYQGALLIVSHDRYFLDKVANKVVELRHNKLHLYKGNYSFYINEKQARLEQEMKEYLKQQSQISKLEDFVARNIVRASTTKRAQSRRKQLEKMNRLEKPKQDAQAPRIQFSAARESGDRVIITENLAVGYQDEQYTDVAIAENINLDLRRQEAIAIVGPNGVGKTTFLKTILQQIPALNGHVSIGTNVDIGYYAQNVNTLNENISVLETLWAAHDTTDEWKIRSILGSFLFTGETVEKKVSMLSGGEKARLALALLATEHDNTLLLDEPTNHLDIDSKEVLEEALIEFDGTLLFVSHDRYFINRIATQILEISPEKSTLYLGDYDYYLTKKAEMETFEEAEQAAQTETVSESAPDPAGKRSYAEGKQLRSQLKKLQLAVDQAWEINEDIEAEVESLHLQLAQAAEENNQSLLLSLDKELKALNKRSETVISEWEYSALELEEFLDLYPDLK